MQELIRGSGNIYKDFNIRDEYIRQVKALLCADINKILDKRKTATGIQEEIRFIPKIHLSKIRNVDLQGFTVQTLEDILFKLTHRSV